jgi:hypothetical protein
LHRSRSGIVNVGIEYYQERQSIQPRDFSQGLACHDSFIRTDLVFHFANETLHNQLVPRKGELYMTSKTSQTVDSYPALTKDLTTSNLGLDFITQLPSHPLRILIIVFFYFDKLLLEHFIQLLLHMTGYEPEKHIRVYTCSGHISTPRWVVNITHRKPFPFIWFESVCGRHPLGHLWNTGIHESRCYDEGVDLPLTCVLISLPS